MPFKQHGRQYDLVLLGATGYTGKLTAEHIVEHLPTDLKWAIAGRTESKLQALVNHIQKLNPDRRAPAIEIADTNSDEQLRSLAEKTFILATTVGPYVLYGETAFKACAEAGTHYLDITGESPWTWRMIKKYEATAKRTGAIMVPQVGIESSPTDLCTWALAQCLRKKLGAKTAETFVCIHELNSLPSGGTLASLFGFFDAFSYREIWETSSPFSWSPVPHAEPKAPPTSLLTKLFGLRRIQNLGLLTSSLGATLDQPVIGRSWGLLQGIPGREHESYGPKFTVLELFKARNWLHGIGMHLGLLFSGLFLALFPPLRWLAQRFVTQPGFGPIKDGKNSIKSEMIEYRGVAYPDTDVPTKKQAFCRVQYAGSMYYLTGMFIGQAAMTILEDDIGLEGGIYTPACLGQGFVDRASKVGFDIETKLLDV